MLHLILSMCNQDYHHLLRGVRYQCGTCARLFESYLSCSQHLHARHATSSSSSLHGICSLALDETSYDDVNVCSQYAVLDNGGDTSALDKRVGWCASRGDRTYSEDFVATVLLRGGMNMTAIMMTDGHLGETAARFGARRVPELLLQTHRSSSIPLFLSKVFMQVQTDFMEAFPHDLTSGAAMTIVVQTQQHLYVANVGDVRAVMQCGDDDHRTWRNLTVDHIASDSIERLRVEQAGGVIVDPTSNAGRARVLGKLALTRSIGDVLMHQKNIGIVAHPHVSEVNLTKACVVIIATDGLWDAMTPDDAFKIVAKTRNNFGVTKNPLWWSRAARALMLEARGRGISSDNVCVCVWEV